MKRLCVFCGSKTGARPRYAQQARLLGELLVQRQIGLVFGGGHIGLMGVLADAMLPLGGEIIGVIPRALMQKELAHTGVRDMRVVETMHQRKALMADLADGFAALPGGFGTGDEFFEILTWAQLGIHAKPIGLLNTEGFFDPLLAWIERAAADGFLRPQDRQLLHVTDDPAKLLQLLVAST